MPGFLFLRPGNLIQWPVPVMKAWWKVNPMTVIKPAPVPKGLAFEETV